MNNPNTQKSDKKRKFIGYLIATFIIIPISFLLYLNYVKIKSKPFPYNTDLSKKLPSDSLNIVLTQAIKLANESPNENNYINLSLAYYRNAQYKNCITASLEALKYNPNSYEAYNNLCSAYNELAYWEKAIFAGEKAVTINSNNPLAQNNLKISYLGKEKFDQQILLFKNKIKTNPNETIYIEFGNTYYNAGEFVSAIQMYTMALQYNNKSVLAYNNICSSYNELEKWEKAKDNCLKALKIDSTFILSQNNLKIASTNSNKK